MYKLIRITKSIYGGCPDCGEKLFVVDEIQCENCGCEHDTPILYLCNCKIKKQEYKCPLCGSTKTVNNGPAKQREV